MHIKAKCLNYVHPSLISEKEFQEQFSVNLYIRDVKLIIESLYYTFVLTNNISKLFTSVDTLTLTQIINTDQPIR